VAVSKMLAALQFSSNVVELMDTVGFSTFVTVT
jgi:hypothetical protein